MDFRTLSYMLAIADHQNMTKASETLYVGQPTLSKALSSLEEELGLKLFRKVGHRYLPTYAGERFLERARELLRLKNRMDEEMADIRRRQEGEVKIAFANMRCSYLPACVLPVFGKRYPRVKVTLFEGNSDLNDRRLLDGQIEAAFYTMPAEKDPRIEYTPLAEERLLICTRKDHPLSQRAVRDPGSPYPRLEPEQLKGERVILMRQDQRTRQIVDSILRKRHLQYDEVFCTSNIQAIMGLVSAGYGVSFVFDSHLKHRPDHLPLDLYCFGDAETVHAFVAATVKGSYVSDACREFIRIVQQSV